MSVRGFYSRDRANRNAEAWYSVTLTLGKIADVVPASDVVVMLTPSDSDTSVGYTTGPVAKYDWDR